MPSEKEKGKEVHFELYSILPRFVSQPTISMKISQQIIPHGMQSKCRVCMHADLVIAPIQQMGDKLLSLSLLLLLLRLQF